ncbi:hypothetical protein KA005_02755 [bacterium]|nr:hypothetical protein [bacterium]
MLNCNLNFISIVNKMSVTGAQITSTGIVPLRRSIIKQHIPFVPNPQNLKPIPERRYQSELNPWTPAMNFLRDNSGSVTTDFAPGLFKIPEGPVGLNKNGALPTTQPYGPIGQLSMRPNAPQKGLIANTIDENIIVGGGNVEFGKDANPGGIQYLPNNDPRVPPSKRGDGNKLVGVYIAGTKSKGVALPFGSNVGGSAMVPPGEENDLVAGIAQALRPSQVTPPEVKVPDSYMDDNVSWQFDNGVYVGSEAQAINLENLNASGQPGLPKNAVSVPAGPFNEDVSGIGAGSFTTVTLANGGFIFVITGGVPFITNTITVTGSGTGMTLAVLTDSRGSVTSATVVNPGTGYKVGDVIQVPNAGAGPADQIIFASLFVGTVIIKTPTLASSSNFKNMGRISGEHGRGGAPHQVFEMYPRISKTKGIFGARRFQPSILAGANLPIAELPDAKGPAPAPGGLPSNNFGNPAAAVDTISPAELLLYAYGFPTGQNILLPNYLLLAGSGAVPEDGLPYTEGSYTSAESKQALREQLIGNGYNSGQGYMKANSSKSTSKLSKPNSTVPNASGAVGIGYIKPKNAVSLGVDKNNPIPLGDGVSRQQVLVSKLSNDATIHASNLAGRTNDLTEEIDYDVAYTGTYPTVLKSNKGMVGPGIDGQIASIPAGGGPPPENPLAPTV